MMNDVFHTRNAAILIRNGLFSTKNKAFEVENKAFAVRNEVLKACFCGLFAAWRLFSKASHTG